MKTPSIDVPMYGPRVAVRLLKPVRASNGQEFQEGMIAGFSRESADYMVGLGLAAFPGQPAVTAPAPAKAPVPDGFQVVTRAPISHGDSPDAIDSKPTEETPKPAQPVSTERRKRY
jgi:hypothetical protein